MISGTPDQCVPELAEQIAAGIPRSELVVLDAGHLPFYEVPEQYFATVRGFLHRIDAHDRGAPEMGPASADRA